MSDSRPTIPIPKPPPVNEWANLPCGVEGFEDGTARGYGLTIVDLVKEGQLLRAWRMINDAIYDGAIDRIELALGRKP